VVRSALVIGCAALIAAAVAGCGGSSAANPPTTTVRHLRQFRIVFPEGFTRVQMAERAQTVAKIAVHESHHKVKLTGKGYAAATAKPVLIQGFGSKRLPLEGFLFPDTYDFDRLSTSAQLVQEQLQEFSSKWSTLNLSYAKSKNLTPYDVLTIASMVEGEAQVPSERPLIAAVIYNRLKQGIPLGIDATIRFATGNWTHPLRVSELHTASAYNTRTHQGLPPGPIGNPGLASLQAAAHPAHVGYLFYVVKPCGNGAHAFSSTDAQFQRDVAKYNSARAKKGGRSPAKC
jgi:uncharacterized YceG family protein